MATGASPSSPAAVCTRAVCSASGSAGRLGMVKVSGTSAGAAASAPCAAGAWDCRSTSVTSGASRFHQLPGPSCRAAPTTAPGSAWRASWPRRACSAPRGCGPAARRPAWPRHWGRVGFAGQKMNAEGAGCSPGQSTSTPMVSAFCGRVSVSSSSTQSASSPWPRAPSAGGWPAHRPGRGAHAALFMARTNA